MLIPNKKSHLNPDTVFTHPNGSEDFTIKHFWQWAFSDLQQNNVRGILAEFIVAKAMNIDLETRQSWDKYDLITSDGIKIEVKCGAYLQNWEQPRHSDIVFSGLCGHVRDKSEGARYGKPHYRADIYVFVVQNALDHDKYDALDLSQWEFYLLTKEQMEQRNTRSISASVVKSMVNPVDYYALASGIQQLCKNAHRQNGAAMKTNTNFGICVYTIVHSNKLDCLYKEGGSIELLENKAWATASNLLVEAKKQGMTLKIVFAAAEDTSDLIYHGDLDDININRKDPNSVFTSYRVSNLFPFSDPKPKKVSLIINSTGKPISGGHIRPYVICNTPEEF